QRVEIPLTISLQRPSWHSSHHLLFSTNKRSLYLICPDAIFTKYNSIRTNWQGHVLCTENKANLHLCVEIY
ncbi:hypothetical protein Q6247_26260, partial [Klebsiella pneumoniae]